ncbi:uncharacterized protein [Pithys albifrons albifrons]|uniref:uncharacterized protein n=1 Tax=Pithys albifrons albifrons TaxID=3385563 RepID=UPI003A5CFDBF
MWTEGTTTFKLHPSAPLWAPPPAGPPLRYLSAIPLLPVPLTEPPLRYPSASPVPSVGPPLPFPSSSPPPYPQAQSPEPSRRASAVPFPYPHAAPSAPALENLTESQQPWNQGFSMPSVAAKSQEVIFAPPYNYQETAYAQQMRPPAAAVEAARPQQ